MAAVNSRSPGLTPVSELYFDRDRELHLKQVLLAIRNVGRLITTETNAQRLASRACQVLTSDLGYHNAWIALTDQNSSRVTMTVSSGFGTRFRDFESRLKSGEFPQCMCKGLASDHLIMVENPVAECHDCP